MILKKFNKTYKKVIRQIKQDTLFVFLIIKFNNMLKISKKSLFYTKRR